MKPTENTVKNGFLNRNTRYVPHRGFMPGGSPVCPGVLRGLYGTHLLDHLAAHGTGLTRGQIAVVAFLQVDANLP